VRRKNTGSRIFWEDAPDIKERIAILKKEGGFSWLDLESVFCLRSKGSKSRAIARIWGLPSLWQKVLNIKPHYVIEVISERYDRLKDREKDDVLLHEIAHIPRNFSGSLVPHYRRGKRKFQDLVKTLKLRYHRQDGNNYSSGRK
jgi:predicted metallopeptidase